MSDSIAIPRAKGKQRLVVSSPDSSPRLAESQDSPISSTASSNSPLTMASVRMGQHRKEMAATSQDKGKAMARDSGMSSPRYGHERRTSLLSSSISKSEHTVVDIGDDDRPRLITCVKASQGFDWNQEIFLPSYLSDRNLQNDLELRQDPVEDIFITEEEAEEMFPR